MIDLIQGDCLELMKDIPDKSIDMILCDAPYGINYQSQWKKDKTKWKPKIINDKKPFVDFIKYLKPKLKEKGCVLLFTRWDKQQYFIDEMIKYNMRPKNILIWNKVIHGMGDLKRAYGSRYESIIFYSNDKFRFNGKRPTDIIKCQRVNASKLLHPNEKPAKLLSTLIEQCTKENDTVLDCFMGSGSTGIACLNTNRNFIGIELDENYFNIAKERIEKAQNELSREI